MGVLMTRREVLLIHTPSMQLKSMDGIATEHRVVGVGVGDGVGVGVGVGVGMRVGLGVGVGVGVGVGDGVKSREA